MKSRRTAFRAAYIGRSEQFITKIRGHWSPQALRNLSVGWRLSRRYYEELHKKFKEKDITDAILASIIRDLEWERKTTRI